MRKKNGTVFCGNWFVVFFVSIYAPFLCAQKLMIYSPLFPYRAAYMSSRTENQKKMCRLYVSVYSRVIGGGKGLYYLLSSGNEEKPASGRKDYRRI